MTYRYLTWKGSRYRRKVHPTVFRLLVHGQVWCEDEWELTCENHLINFANKTGGLPMDYEIKKHTPISKWRKIK